MIETSASGPERDETLDGESVISFLNHSPLFDRTFISDGSASQLPWKSCDLFRLTFRFLLQNVFIGQRSVSTIPLGEIDKQTNSQEGKDEERRFSELVPVPAD